MIDEDRIKQMKAEKSRLENHLALAEGLRKLRSYPEYKLLRDIYSDYEKKSLLDVLETNENTSEIEVKVKVKLYKVIRSWNRVVESILSKTGSVNQVLNDLENPQKRTPELREPLKPTVLNSNVNIKEEGK